MEKEIIVPSAPILVESTRSVGYSFEAAIADIIDNSISARAKNININFEIKPREWLYIKDDGCGMTKNELVNAMRYGSKSSLAIRDAKDLGRFGLGMKMASLSQCRKVTVITKKAGKVYGACWDLDYLIQNNDWTLKVYSEDECLDFPGVTDLCKQDSGTLVIWETFDRLHNEAKEFYKNFNERISVAKKHVALVFHRFLNGIGQDRIHVSFNYDEIIGMDPFLTENPATQQLQERRLTIDNQTILVKPYILPIISKIKKKDLDSIGGKENLRQKQGFYVYRNKRLIIWGTWFRLIGHEELGKLARVQVDIPNTLDSLWEIDIKKSTASLPFNVKKQLANIVKDAVGSSALVYRYRGRNVQTDKIVHLWNPIEDRGNFTYKVNREFPLYQELSQSLPEDKQGLLTSFVKMLETTLPYYDIYCRYCDEKHADTELSDEEVFEMAQSMINELKQINIDITGFLDSLESLEPFNKKPEVISKIKEVFSNE